MNNATTELARAFDFAWQSIQQHNPEVPDVVIVTGRRRAKNEHAIRGQHCTDVWRVQGFDSQLAEVWISGERLADGPEQAMCTLLHEAAHALAQARGVKDTSNRNRYHNSKFADLARELGLEPPENSAGPSLGYSNCTILADTEKLYSKAIEKIRASGAVVLPSMQITVKVKKPKRTAHCGCDGAVIPWSKAMDKYVEEFGPVQHQTCREFINPEDEL